MQEAPQRKQSIHFKGNTWLLQRSQATCWLYELFVKSSFTKNNSHRVHSTTATESLAATQKALYTLIQEKSSTSTYKKPTNGGPSHRHGLRKSHTQSTHDRVTSITTTKIESCHSGGIVNPSKKAAALQLQETYKRQAITSLWPLRRTHTVHSITTLKIKSCHSEGIVILMQEGRSTAP